jgi:GNAT superfamily N-acetyltransferase
MSVARELISYRTVNDADEPFLLELYQSSRGDDLRGLGWSEDRIRGFLRMQYEAKRKIDANDFGAAVDEVILLDGEPIGRLAVEQLDQEIRCHELALLPEYRNRGIGTMILRALQERAATAKSILRLKIIRFSRAVNLLERLGFVRTSETGSHLKMEWISPDQDNED